MVLKYTSSSVLKFLIEKNYLKMSNSQFKKRFSNQKFFENLMHDFFNEGKEIK